MDLLVTERVDGCNLGRSLLTEAQSHVKTHEVPLVVHFLSSPSYLRNLCRSNMSAPILVLTDSTNVSVLGHPFHPLSNEIDKELDEKATIW